MEISTEIAIAKLSYADLKAMYDYCRGEQNHFKKQYQALADILLNELQFRCHEIFDGDPLFGLTEKQIT